MSASSNPRHRYLDRVDELAAAQAARPDTREPAHTADTSPEQQGQREAPRESGQRLGTLARPGRYGKPAEELRVTADRFNDNDFLGARIWTQGHDGNFYPTQRGITVRRSEIADFIKAMVAGADALGIDTKGGK